MKSNRRSLLLLVVASAASAALASESGLSLTLEVVHAGESRQLPNVWCNFGQEVTVQVEPSISVEFTARDRGTAVELAFLVHQAAAPGQPPLELPRALVEFGANSVIRISAASGEQYALAFRAERSARPSWLGHRS